MVTVLPRGEMCRLSTAVVLSVCLSIITAETQHCVDVNNDANYKVDEIEGTWYPIEIVLHRNDSKIYGVPLDTQCPSVTFTASPKNRKVIFMVWNSTDGDLEFKFTQIRKNQWQANYDQRGSLVSDDYRQYGGVFSVLKLEGDFMFLTYCSKSYRVLNSVAFSRSGSLAQDVVEKTLAELEDKRVKRSKEIKIQSCEDPGAGRRLMASCLLLVLPSLVVRFPL